MQTAKFVVLFLIWSAKTKSSVTVKMLNSYKVVTKQKGVRIMRQYHETEKKEIQKLAKMYREFLDAGLYVTINTDNRMVSGTSMTRELSWLSKEFQLTKEEAEGLMRNAAKAAFAPEEIKKKLVREI